MRFLIHEMPYESPLSAGRYTYQQDGQPTGAVESWRLTTAVEGYRVLRVDLDAREAASGDSYLYHLLLDPAGKPERLTFRFFRPGHRVEGNLLFEAGLATLSREVNGQQHEAELALAPQSGFWFPAATGLWLLADLPVGVSDYPAVTLDRERDFDLLPVQLSLEVGTPHLVKVAGREVETRPLTIRWADQARTAWLDETGWPVQVQRRELLAVCTQYVRYGASS